MNCVAAAALVVTATLGGVSCKSDEAKRRAAAQALPQARASDGPLAQMPALELAEEPSRPDKIARGRQLFDSSCRSCHANDLWNVGYFVGAFGSDGTLPTLEAAAVHAMAPAPGDDVASALAEFLRTRLCNDTAYDKGAAGDARALTEQQKLGFDLFMTKGQCGTCHVPPFFSSAMGVAGGVLHEGRKPPTLRNVTKSAPYFHDGSIQDLAAAATHTAEARLLTSDERVALLAFLSALDCAR